MENNQENSEKKKPKTLKVQAAEHIVVSEKVRLTSIREFYEKNPKILTVVILFTIASSLIGLFISGLPGAIVGLALGAIAFGLSPKAIIKAREIRH